MLESAQLACFLLCCQRILTASSPILLLYYHHETCLRLHMNKNDTEHAASRDLSWSHRFSLPGVRPMAQPSWHVPMAMKKDRHLPSGRLSPCCVVGNYLSACVNVPASGHHGRDSLTALWSWPSCQSHRTEHRQVRYQDGVRDSLTEGKFDTDTSVTRTMAILFDLSLSLSFNFLNQLQASRFNHTNEPARV